MANLDMKKTLKHLFTPSTKQIGVVDVPPLPYLMIDGEGNPNTSQEYVEALQALYNMAYAIRAICKEEGDVFTVMPLEGLWMVKGMEGVPEDFQLTPTDKDNFVWTMMILQPDFVTVDMVEQARENVSKKKPAPPRLAQVYFETYHEGDAAQLMHIGPYADEGPNIAKIHQYIAENGWKLSKKHHEIYLSDPRKVAPEKMKTVIRQPFDRS